MKPILFRLQQPWLGSFLLYLFKILSSKKDLWKLESHQTVIRRSSDSPTIGLPAIRQPSNSHQTENFFILVFLFFLSWRGFYYSSVFLYGCSVLWNKPWLWDIKHCWYNYPLHRIDGDV